MKWVFALALMNRVISEITHGVKALKLTYPNTNVPFNPSPMYFLGEFDVYDREESLEDYLNQFDPNDRAEVNGLLRELFFQGAREKTLTLAHKAVLVETLLGALRDSNYDFLSVPQPEEDDTFCLPFDWEVEDGRLFLEEAYRLAIEFWKVELRDLGVLLPSLSELEIE